MPAKKLTKWKLFKKGLILSIGSIITAAGLEFFLIPNHIVDGGVVGISIMLSYLTDWPVGILIFVLNAPFWYLGYRQIGKTFAISTVLSTISLSFWVSVFHPIPGLTNDLFLSAVFGGIIIGAGVGLIIRTGGSVDGTEMVAIILDRKSGFSVGEIIMFINLFILSCAGFIFSWDKALYSMVAYFVAVKVIDLVIRGFDESKGVIIVSECYREITDAITHRLGRGVTLLKGESGRTGKESPTIYVVVTRLEVSKLKNIVMDIDDKAFFTINEVQEVMYANMHKKAIH